MRYSFLVLVMILVFIYILQLLIGGLTGILVLNSYSFIQPWRFVTAIFLHGSPGHLLYNLFALLLFGFILENILGTRRFLLVFFISGILANLLSVFFYPSSLGASGAIFGIIGCLTILRPTMAVWAFSLPMPLIVASSLWVIGNVIGVFVPSDVANFAHLGGIIVGIFFGAAYWTRFRRIKVNRDKLEIPEHIIRSWEDVVMRH